MDRLLPATIMCVALLASVLPVQELRGHEGCQDGRCKKQPSAVVVLVGCPCCQSYKDAKAYLVALKKRWDHFEIAEKEAPEGWPHKNPAIFVVKQTGGESGTAPFQAGFDQKDKEALRKLHAELERVAKSK